VRTTQGVGPGALLIAALLAALAACGPGTGGTGTGESADLALFGASAADLCGAPFAARLDCAGAAVTPAPSSEPGSGTVPLRYVDPATGGNVAAEIEGHHIRLLARCDDLAFDGVWGVAPELGARFYGGYHRPSHAARVPATLAVEALPGDARAGLAVVLRDAGGRVVLGPTALAPATSGQPPPAACR
jgi:hypothetical protein